MGPTEPPIQQAPGAHTPAAKQMGHEANHSPSTNRLRLGGAIPPLSCMPPWHEQR